MCVKPHFNASVSKYGFNWFDFDNSSVSKKLQQFYQQFKEIKSAWHNSYLDTLMIIL